MELKDIIKGIEKEGIFDFVANNYWKLSKEDLRDIAKELSYAVYDKLGNEVNKEIEQATIENLKELED